VTSFVPGVVFELTDHPVPEANGEHLLVSVTHHVTPDGDGPEEGGTGHNYRNELDAQPKPRPFRPARITPHPAIPGIETAIVVGAAGEEIHTEQHGRIKVQFHWDRDGASDDHSSCWLRVAQPWAGASWGFVWTPRIGMEVVVRFEQGDPDRPLVTDALYTGANTPPYALPDEKTKSTIKSNSSLGGGGFNELRFEDKAGSEEVFQHAQKDLDEVVLDNHSTHVGAHQSNEVDKDQLQEIKGNQEETIATTQNLDVGGNRKVTVDGGFDETVTGSQTRTVKAGSTESIAGSETHEVLDGGLLELITAKETRTVTGGLTDNLHDFAGLLVTGAVTETVSASMLRKAASIKHDASASMTMTGTAGIDMNGNTGISIRSPQYKRLTSRHTRTIATQTDDEKTKVALFPLVIDMIGAKADCTSYAFEIAGSKFDVTGLAAGAYGLAFSAVGGSIGNKAAAWIDLTAFALDGNGFRRVK
jgi:type VI secretion system secreted protein VgrG